MTNARRLGTALGLVLLATTSAWAEDATHGTITAWGVLHVGVSLAGTVVLLWLIKRGVEKL